MGVNRITQISKILGAAARQNKYRVSFAWPSGVPASTPVDEVDVLAKSATAPQREIGMLEFWNQGRKLVIPGDTVFDNTWSLDFYLTENHSLRYDMVKWQTAMDNFHANMHSGQPLSVTSSLKIEQLDSAGEVSAQYTLHNCFPSVVGEVTYDDSAENSPGEFNVTFTYSDWVLGDGETDACSPITPTKNENSLTC